MLHVSADHHLPSFMMIMAYIWIYPIHINTVGIFGQLVVDVSIWVSIESPIHLLPRLVMRESDALTPLQWFFYLFKKYIDPVTDNHNLPSCMVFMVEIFPSKIHRNTVVICGQLIVGVEIWAPGNPSINLFPRVSMHMNKLRTTLQSMFYLATVEEAPVSDNFHLPSGMVFMSDIWEYSIHNDGVWKLGWLIVGVVILYPSC